MRRSLLVGVVGFAVVVGCSDNGTGTGGGTFTATVSGDLSMTLSGQAVFGTQTGSDGTTFGIALIRGDANSLNSDIIIVGRANTSRPSPGTYEIVSALCSDCTDDDFDAGLAIVRPDDFGAYLSDAGTFTITSSSAERIVGSGTMTMTSFIQFQTAQTVTIEFTFTAVPGDLPTPG